MDASKVKSSQPVQQVQQTKRTEENRQAQREVKAQTAEVKKSPYDTPRATVNNQGQTIGGRLSVTA